MNKHNILIIDDDINSIQLAINILKQNNTYNIIFTTSGKEAIKRVQEYKFDLILLDIIMEPMSGFEVCEYFKKDSSTSDIPIIFLTAKDDEQSIEKGFELGAVDYITKPFFANELIARVQTHVNLKTYKDELKRKLELQDKLMLEQNKMAAMGEMIANIAHQWKQPLSVITTLSSSIKLNKELDLDIDDSEELASLDHILLNANHLAETIDDFKNFFKQKPKVLFDIEDVINRTINLINSNLKHYDITIKKDINKFKFIGLDNELIQVLINIINNAQDALKESNNETKLISIKAYEQNSNAIIKIKDNAGGIADDILPNIFNQYFTTKSASKGTGIGLYMAKKIIIEHFNGTIDVHNIEYDNNKGAEFIIKLPIEFEV
jgi:signal transduction histidine kinase